MAQVTATEILNRIDKLSDLYPDLVSLHVIDELANQDLVSDKCYYEHGSIYMSRIRDGLERMQLTPDQLQQELDYLQLGCSRAIFRLNRGFPEHIKRKFNSDQLTLVVSASDATKDLQTSILTQTNYPRQFIYPLKMIRGTLEKISFKSGFNYVALIKKWEDKISLFTESQEMTEEETQQILADLDVLSAAYKTDV